MARSYWLAATMVISGSAWSGCGGAAESAAPPVEAEATPIRVGATVSTVVLGYNDLGMHCMNRSFAELMVLPPFNTLHAQVIDRKGPLPKILTGGLQVDYSVPGNTHSADKSDFWSQSGALLGVSPPLDVGLTGNALAGSMAPSGQGDWVASGIPLTPITDQGKENPFQLATITVRHGAATLASTQAVVPVSWEISCELCHNGSDAPDILEAHDLLHKTTLQSRAPVACGSCHPQAPLAPLGLTGKRGVSTLSSAMHTAHAPRMDDVMDTLNGNACYACHPGPKTQCLRDIHYQKNMTCTSCHVSMEAVGNPSRRPWVDLPRCGSCHRRGKQRYEQPDTLYRNSTSHHGVACASCHGSPHAITPTVVAADNVQAIALQGTAGTIKRCGVCHQTQPGQPFRH